MNELMEWLGDVFYVERSVVEHHEGYTTEYYRDTYSSGSRVVTVDLPFEEDVTTTTQVFNWQAGCAFILVCMVFLTIVTWLRGALK